MNASRKRRVAAGSGTSVQDVNKVLKMHRQMADMMKKLGKGGMKGLAGMLGGGLGGGMLGSWRWHGRWPAKYAGYESIRWFRWQTRRVAAGFIKRIGHQEKISLEESTAQRFDKMLFDERKLKWFVPVCRVVGRKTPVLSHCCG